MRALAQCLFALAVVLCASPSSAGADEIAVVAHVDTPALDESTLQKVYLGKIVEVDGRVITPVNMARGSALRNAFMKQILTQDDEKFVAYWTVRRYIGKGTPPIEFSTVEQQLQFVRSTPGAVGYVDQTADLKQGLKTLLRRP